MTAKELAIAWHMENCKVAVLIGNGKYVYRAKTQQEAEAEVNFRLEQGLPLTGWGREPADVD